MKELIEKVKKAISRYEDGLIADDETVDILTEIILTNVMKNEKGILNVQKG